MLHVQVLQFPQMTPGQTRRLDLSQLVFSQGGAPLMLYELCVKFLTDITTDVAQNS